MEAESFFARWSKRNAEAVADNRAAAAVPVAQPAPDAEDIPLPPPTLEDVAQLTADSDFKPFVARGVDEDIRRSAMKKLFADPHFNVMDGLDVYIEDYNKFEPIPASMLAALNHAQTLLNPLAQLGNPLMELIDAIEKEEQPAPQLAQEAASKQDVQDVEDNGGEEPSSQETPNHDDQV